MQVQPCDCVGFEDSPTGLQSGATSGAGCIVGLETTLSSLHLQSYAPDIRIRDYTGDFCHLVQHIHMQQL